MADAKALQSISMPPARLRAKDYWEITKRTFTDFGNDNVMNSAAIISYYTVFSLPAVLILILKLASIAVGEDAVSGRLFGQIKGIVGTETAAQIQSMVKAASQTGTGVMAAIVGIATLAFSATTVFISLQEALNNVWGVKAKPQKGWLKYIINRLLSISILGMFAFLLLVSLSADAFISVISNYLEHYFSEVAVILARTVDILLSLTLVTGLFGLIFKVLPDARIRWRSVWTGAFVTTVLFVAGKTAIGWYIGFSGTQSTYGTAGSIVLIMLWVYYSAVILLLGAEFTKAYAHASGHDIEPSDQAVKVEVKEIHTNSDGEVETVKTKSPDEGVQKQEVQA